MVEDYQNNYGKGWISLYRSIKNHWVWSDAEKLKWWLTILFEVNHANGKVAIGYNVIECNRGQSLKSIRTWSELFGCGTKATTSFFDMLEKDGMVKRETIGKGKHSTTLLTVCNYDTYQNGKGTEETLDAPIREHKGNANGTQVERKGHTNNNDNNANNEEEEETIITAFDIFWKAYDYNVGLRQAQHEWTQITREMPNEIAKILEHVPKYVRSKPDKQFRKRPENYLKERVWMDEIEEPKKPEPKKYRIPL
jgi:hypothetical protein